MGEIRDKSFYATSKKPGDVRKCKKCGKAHDQCFDTAAAVRKQFLREFRKFMED